MCTTCGCGEKHSHTHTHRDENGNLVTHTHEEHVHEHEPQHTHDSAMGTERAISIEEDILARNNTIANENRAFFRQKHILALNFVSSPGSGKTELLCATVRAAAGQFSINVIEGDQQTSNDANRVRATGVQAHQINTGKGCHLDADMVRHAIEHMDLDDSSILFIENVEKHIRSSFCQSQKVKISRSNIPICSEQLM